MPKVTVDENRDLFLLKNDIGRPWQFLTIAREAQAFLPKLSLNQQLQRAAFEPHTLHGV
jgi:hypothetical protein